MILKFKLLIDSLLSFHIDKIALYCQAMSADLLVTDCKPASINEGDQPAASITSNAPPHDNAYRGSNSASTTGRSMESLVGKGRPSSEQDELMPTDGSENGSTIMGTGQGRKKRRLVNTLTCTKRGKGINNDGVCGRPLDSEDVAKYMRCKPCREKGVSDKRKSLQAIAEGRGVRKHLGKGKRKKDQLVRIQLYYETDSY